MIPTTMSWAGYTKSWYFLASNMISIFWVMQARGTGNSQLPFVTLIWLKFLVSFKDLFLFVYIFFSVDCKLSPWSPCSKTCGPGTQTRFVEFEPENGGQKCSGSRRKSCNIRSCPGKKYKWLCQQRSSCDRPRSSLECLRLLRPKVRSLPHELVIFSPYNWLVQ